MPETLIPAIFTIFAVPLHAEPPHLADAPTTEGTPDGLMLTRILTVTGACPAFSAALIVPDALVTCEVILEISEVVPGTLFPGHCPDTGAACSSHSQLLLQRSFVEHELFGAEESHSSPVSTLPFPQAGTGGGLLTVVGLLLGTH